MKTLTHAMQGHLAGRVTTLATCWRVERPDGVALHFTDHDVDIVFDGATYKASTGYTRSTIATERGLSVDDLEIEGLLDDDQLAERDLRLGLLDGAEVRIFMVNWADPAMGMIPLRRGTIGEVTLQHNGVFQAELRGLADRLQQTVIEFYSPMCRADLGDERCGVDIAARGVAGTIVSVTDATRFTVSLSGSLAAFTGGLIIFTGGENAGATLEVMSWNAPGNEVTLFMGAVYQLAAGDAFTLVPGCDKTFSTCRDTFDNAVNFRGEPFLPGSDTLRAYPTSNTGAG